MFRLRLSCLAGYFNNLVKPPISLFSALCFYCWIVRMHMYKTYKKNSYLDSIHALMIVKISLEFLESCNFHAIFNKDFWHPDKDFASVKSQDHAIDNKFGQGVMGGLQESQANRNWTSICMETKRACETAQSQKFCDKMVLKRKGRFLTLLLLKISAYKDCDGHTKYLYTA